MCFDGQTIQKDEKQQTKRREAANKKTRNNSERREAVNKKMRSTKRREKVNKKERMKGKYEPDLFVYFKLCLYYLLCLNTTNRHKKI